MITVLSPHTSFVYLYSALPFFLSRHRREFLFTSDPQFVLSRDKNRVLILIRWFSASAASADDQKRFIGRLRQRYDRIVYFDDGDSASSDLFHLLPLLDLMLRKQVCRDAAVYLKPHKGNRVYAEYAIDRLGAADNGEPGYSPAAPDQLEKIRPAWHLGIGLYPPRYWKEKLLEGIFPAAGSAAVRAVFRRPRQPVRIPRRRVCHARFSAKGYPVSIGFQRAMLLEKIKDDSRFLSGFIDKKAYMTEMNQVAAVLSPFGWGEVCFRDFEAVGCGAVLIKPTMDHIETWPDSYRSWQTYAPLEWDASNLDSVVERVLDDDGLADALREQAWQNWNAAFDGLEARVELVLRWCLGDKS